MQEYKVMLLCAGVGSRLAPYTNHLPKCLMPILKKPLLDIWIEKLKSVGVEEVAINVHHHPEIMMDYIENHAKFSGMKIHPIRELELFGTAGTLKENVSYFKDKPCIVIHADNLSLFSWEDFFKTFESKPKYCSMTMMLFKSQNPSSCGIVGLDDQGVVTSFVEKPAEPVSNLANAAVYIIEPSIVDYIALIPGKLIDLSTQVIPHFIEKTNTFVNQEYHRDIGTPESLKLAQIEFRKYEKDLGEVQRTQFYERYHSICSKWLSDVYG